MFRFFSKLRAKRKRRHVLLNFYQEVAKNWESWHVMHQRNVADKFSLTSWQKVQENKALNANQKILNYINLLIDYNQGMDEFRSYEQWYVSDIENKTTENAKVLHTKKEIVATKFNGLLAVVESVKTELERQLQEQKIKIPCGTA